MRPRGDPGRREECLKLAPPWSRAKKDYGAVVCIDVAEYEVDVDAAEKGDERTKVFYSVGCSSKRGHPAPRD